METGTQVGITYQDMTTTAETLRSLVQQLDQTLDEAKNEINTNIGNDDVWNSEAARDYKTKFITLSEVFPEFKEELIKCSKFLDETVVASYKKAEAKIQEAAAQNLTTGINE